VTLSVTSRSSVETAEQIELVFVRELPSTYPTLLFNEIRTPTEVRVLPSGTLSQNLSLENFATAHISSQRTWSTHRRDNGGL